MSAGSTDRVSVSPGGSATPVAGLLIGTVRAGRRDAGVAFAVACLALLASFNGLWNDFAYDDLFIVRGNAIVHETDRLWRAFLLPYWPLHLGGDGYRPLTILMFGLQWAIAPGSAMLFHAVNILLYAAVAVAGFAFARCIMPARYAFVAAALFAVHPVHVEAVANVVGQSELWAALAILLAMTLYLRGRDDRDRPVSAGVDGSRQSPGKTRGRGRYDVIVVLLYFVACLFKEHAVMLPALLLASEALLGSREEPLRQRLWSRRSLWTGLLVAGVSYLALRQLILHKDVAGFAPFIPFVSLQVDAVDRVLTMLGVVPHWLRLLLWPTGLSSEYGPPDFPIATSFGAEQLLGLAILCALAALLVATARRRPLIAFGILWTGISLLPSSNVLLPSGILLAERTLFTPSFGAMLAIAAALPLLHPRGSVARIGVLVAAGSALWAGIALSIVRSAVWRDNDRLFTEAVRTSPGVYRSHYMLGAWLMSKRQYADGERYYLESMRLFGSDPFVPYNLAGEYFAAGLYDKAYEMYARSERIMPGFQDAMARMALARAAQGRYADADSLARVALRTGVGDSTTLRSIVEAASLDAAARQRVVALAVERRGASHAR